MIVTWKKYLNYNFPKPSHLDRDHIERLIGQKFPEKYWELVENYQGYIPDPKMFIIKETLSEESFGVLLHVLEPSKVLDPQIRYYSVISDYNIKKKRYSSKVVPFSDDTGGNNLAFDFRKKKDPRIVFINHNFSGNDSLAFVANNFAELLDMLSPRGD